MEILWAEEGFQESQSVFFSHTTMGVPVNHSQYSLIILLWVILSIIANILEPFQCGCSCQSLPIFSCQSWPLFIHSQSLAIKNNLFEKFATTRCLIHHIWHIHHFRNKNMDRSLWKAIASFTQTDLFWNHAWMKQREVQNVSATYHANPWSKGRRPRKDCHKWSAVSSSSKPNLKQ